MDGVQKHLLTAVQSKAFQAIKHLVTPHCRHTGKVTAWVMASNDSRRTISLMPVAEANILPETCNASGLPGCSSQPAAHLRDSGERTAAMQQSTGIMAQYLEASQRQLGAVHGHSTSLSKQWQQIGAAREGKLDDVAYIRVGRGGSVQSVYDSNQSIRGNSKEGNLEVCQSEDNDKLQDSSSNVQ